MGANAFVNKAFPANSCLAGNPAGIIREKVAWRKECYPLYTGYEDFAMFDYTDDAPLI